MSLPKPYYQDGSSTIYHGDCLELLPLISNINLVLTDPPYGITGCSWDSLVNMHPILNFDCPMKVVFANQPLTSKLISESTNFKYMWYWKKEKGTGFQLANKMPMRIIEDILVFYEAHSKTHYHPPKKKRKVPVYVKVHSNTTSDSSPMRSTQMLGVKKMYDDETPTNLIEFSRESQAGESYHPTQKPLELMSFLVQTYTDIGETILDPFMGSGTTILASKNNGRMAVGIEKEEKYCEIAAKRLAQEVLQL